MEVVILYSSQSDIAKTNPLICSLFRNSIINIVDTINSNYGLGQKVPVTFKRVSDELCKHSYEVMILGDESCKFLGEVIEESLKANLELCYRSINKFESLLDMFGGADPQKLYGSTCFKEMEL